MRKVTNGTKSIAIGSEVLVVLPGGEGVGNLLVEVLAVIGVAGVWLDVNTDGSTGRTVGTRSQGHRSNCSFPLCFCFVLV